MKLKKKKEILLKNKKIISKDQVNVSLMSFGDLPIEK